MNIPLFPKRNPKLTDGAWFNVDPPCAHEEEVTQLEKEHQEWVIFELKLAPYFLILCCNLVSVYFRSNLLQKVTVI